MNRGVLNGLGPGDGPDVASGDAGQNALLVAGHRREVRFAWTAAGATPVIDVSNYRTALIQLTASSFATSVLGSNDGASFSSLNTIDTNGAIATGAMGSTGIYVVPIICRYLKVNNASGTTTGVMVLVGWPVNAPAQTLGVVSVKSGDQPSDSYNTGTGLSALNLGYVGSTGWDRLRTPTTFKTATATASGDTALWTPTASKKFRLMRYSIQATPDVATAAGGVVDATLRDSTTDLNTAFSFYAPAASAPTTTPDAGTGWVDLGNGKLSAAANNVLNINLSTALTAGKVRVVACGTEE